MTGTLKFRTPDGQWQEVLGSRGEPGLVQGIANPEGRQVLSVDTAGNLSANVGFTEDEAAPIKTDWEDVRRRAKANIVVSADWFSNPAAAADAAGPGGTVQFTPGVTYSFAIPIPMQTGQRFVGYGAVLIPTGESAFRVKTPSATTRRVSIEGIEINGGNIVPYGIDFRALVDSSIDSVWIRNILTYGVWFGGEHDSGGWSNRITRSRVGTAVNGAAIYMDGKNSARALNANNNLVQGCVLQCNGTGNGYALHIAQGGENRIIANDMGYGASTAMVLGAEAINTYGSGNRVEKAAGALTVAGSDNMFHGDFYGTPAAGYSGYNVTVTGPRNEILPAFAAAGSQSSWINLSAGNGSRGLLSGIERRRTATEVVQSYRAQGDTFNRLEVLTNGTIRMGSGAAAPDVQLDRFSENVLRVQYGDTFMVEGGGWNEGHLQIGAYHLWVDTSGRLRIKNGEPTSSTDGTVVGSQT